MGDFVNFNSRVGSLEKAGIVSRRIDSPAEMEEKKQKLEKVIDKFLRGVGVDVNQNTDERGVRFFTFGSATGMVFAVLTSNDVYLEVIAPLFEIPADKELLLPLYRELLELNDKLVGAMRIGLSGNYIAVTTAYPFAMLDLATENEVGFLIHTTMDFADRIDDELRKKYDKTTAKRS